MLFKTRRITVHSVYTHTARERERVREGGRGGNIHMLVPVCSTCTLSLSYGAHLLAAKLVHTSARLAATPTRIRMFIAYTHTHTHTHHTIIQFTSQTSKQPPVRNLNCHFLALFISCSLFSLALCLTRLSSDKVRHAERAELATPTWRLIVLNAAGSYLNTFSISNATAYCKMAQLSSGASSHQFNI